MSEQLHTTLWQPDGLDWPFIIAPITNHYRTHHQRIRLSGDVSCTYLLTHLAPSEVSRNPDERVLLFAVFGAAGYLAEYYLFGQVTATSEMMGRILRKYARWDQRGRRQLSDAGMYQVRVLLSNVHWVLYVSGIVDVNNLLSIVSWTSDNGI